MVILNVVLLIILVILLYFDVAISNKKKKIQSRKFHDLINLKNLIKKLSDDFIGQVLVIKNENKTLIEILKYQERNMWGIKIFFCNDINNEKYSLLKSKFSEIEIVRKAGLNSENKQCMVINCKNNLEIVSKISLFLINDILELTNKNNFDIFFKCISIEV